MKSASNALAILAAALFGYSLTLPALQIIVLGKPSTWEGWRATAFAVYALADVAQEPSFLLLGATGLGNIAFLIVPLVLLFNKKPSINVLRALTIAAVCLLVLALWAPHVLPDERIQPLLGYFIWILACVALFGSTFFSLIQRTKTA